MVIYAWGIFHISRDHPVSEFAPSYNLVFSHSTSVSRILRIHPHVCFCRHMLEMSLANAIHLHLAWELMLDHVYFISNSWKHAAEHAWFYDLIVQMILCSWWAQPHSNLVFTEYLYVYVLSRKWKEAQWFLCLYLGEKQWHCSMFSLFWWRKSNISQAMVGMKLLKFDWGETTCI